MGRSWCGFPRARRFRTPALPWSWQSLRVMRQAVTGWLFPRSSGQAGEILQKWVNKQFKADIYGDFSEYTSTSKPLRDFIYECSQGNAVFFVSTRQEAEERLCRV